MRSERALTQTVGRAARNVNGMVIMYADRITNSMQRTIDETNRRRIIQEEYNKEHGITPTQIKRTTESILKQTKVAGREGKEKIYDQRVEMAMAADPVIEYMTKDQLQKSIKKIKSDMEKAAKELDFIEAARLRDEMFILENKLKSLE